MYLRRLLIGALGFVYFGLDEVWVFDSQLKSGLQWRRLIELVTVFDAILTSRQTREKLQCLYENLMSNNFRKTAVLKKNIDCKLKLYS